MKLPDDSTSHPTGGTTSFSMTVDQRPNQSVLLNHTERRKNPRTPIRRLAYVNLEPYDNGGVITDISRDGLRFHMVKPVDHGGVVRLSILLGSTSHLHAVAELVWLDPTRKIGGVRFTVLPDGATDQILDWAKGSSGVGALRSKSSPRTGKTENEPVPNPPFSSQSQPKAAITPDNTTAAPITPTHAPMQAAPAQVAPTQAASAQATGEANTSVAWVPPTDIPVPPQPPQAEAQTSTGPQIKTRSPWVPSSVRPAAPTTPAQARPQPPDLRDPSIVSPQPWTRPDGSRQAEAMPWITHFDPDPPAREGSFVRGVLGGFLLCALLGAGAWYALRHHLVLDKLVQVNSPQISNPAASSPIPPGAGAQPFELPGNSSTVDSLSSDPKQLGPPPQASSPSTSQALQSSPAAQARSNVTDPFAPKASAAPQSSASPLVPSPQPAIAESAPLLTPNAQNAVPTAPLPNAPKTNPFPAPLASADAGESQLMLARQYLDGRLQPRNPTVASQLLWSAVEKGNSAAEMDLADLYLHGDGVARNCDQARVLLSVASEKGNTEAMEKLRELNRTGCR